MKSISLLFLYICITTNLYAIGSNSKFQDFNYATKQLLNKVYSKVDKKTIYCKATFNNAKVITNANGFKSDKYVDRSKILEWEHIVPAKAFGIYFDSWINGHPSCLEKGRKCAKKVNKEFRYMLSDLYNIYPSIGTVNVLRQDYEFKQLTIIDNSYFKSITSFANSIIKDKESNVNYLGFCPMIIKNKKAEPPKYAKGIVARTYLYMNKVYPKYKYGLSYKQKILFKKWSKNNPVTKDECHRAKLISKLQGNHNKIVKTLCEKAKLYK